MNPQILTINGRHTEPVRGQHGFSDQSVLRNRSGEMQDWFTILVIFAFLIGYACFFWLHPYFAVLFAGVAVLFTVASATRRPHQH